MVRCIDCGNLDSYLDGTGNINYLCATSRRCHHGCHCGGVPIKRDRIKLKRKSCKRFVKYGEGKGVAELPPRDASCLQESAETLFCATAGCALGNSKLSPETSFNFGLITNKIWYRITMQWRESRF